MPSSSALLLRPLSHVCSRWYSAALAYSTLWRYVSTCADSPIWVHASLTRARSAHDLWLDVRSSERNLVPDHVAHVLAEAGRAHSLSLAGPALEQYLDYLPQQSLPRLTNLSVHGAPSLAAYDIASLFRREMPRLRALDVAACIIPWGSSFWNDVGKNLACLSLGHIPHALRPGPHELHLFLSTLSTLECLCLDYILPIYPPAGSPSSTAVPKVLLPRLQSLIVNERCLLSTAAFLGSVARQLSDCFLGVTFTMYHSTHPLPPAYTSMLTRQTTELAVAASTFMRSPIVCSTTQYDLALRGSASQSLTYELRPFGFSDSDIALFRFAVVMDGLPLPTVPAQFSDSSLSRLIVAPTEPDYIWPAIPLLVFPYALMVNSLDVDAFVFEHPRLWAWSFTGPSSAALTHVTAHGSAAFGLLAAFVLPPNSNLSLHTPPYLHKDQSASVDETCHKKKKRPVLSAMTHLTLRAVDFAWGLDSIISSTLQSREASEEVAKIACVRLEQCLVTQSQVAALRSCSAIQHTDWDGICV